MNRLCPATLACQAPGTNQWQVASFDWTIRFDLAVCRALITAERDGYFDVCGLRERISGRLLRSIGRFASILRFVGLSSRRSVMATLTSADCGNESVAGCFVRLDDSLRSVNCRALITAERDGYFGVSGLRERISGRLLRSIRRFASVGRIVGLSSRRSVMATLACQGCGNESVGGCFVRLDDSLRSCGLSGSHHDGA